MPLHLFAERDHFGVCKLIIEKVQRKNPGNNVGDTPLHLAAKFGNLDVFNLIIEFRNQSSLGSNSLQCSKWPDH